MNWFTQNRPLSEKHRLTIREMALFAMYGALMYASKVFMELLPNIHLLGMLTMLFTVVYRKKALIPIYVYVFLNGLLAGFALWWIPYLYIWTALWGATMLLPKRMPKPVAMVVYPVTCFLHGLAFGTLYAPTQALMFGLNFNQTITWIAAGLPFDAIHAIGNLATGLLIVPLAELLKKINRKYML